MQVKKLVIVGVALAVLAGGAFAANVAASQQDTSKPQDSESQASEPRGEQQLAAEDRWMTGQEMSDSVPAAFAELDAYIEYPNAESRAEIQQMLSRMVSDDKGMYEEGLQYQFVLDNWTCAWAAHARDAADGGDAAEVVRAGEQLMTRLDVPGQRELSPGWEPFSKEFIVPLLSGDYDQVRENWDFQCFRPTSGGDESLLERAEP